MKHLLSIAKLTTEDVEQLFSLAQTIKNGHQPNLNGLTCAYSFEGNSLRTRITFLKALAKLEMTAIELPNLLKTKEEKQHLAGYLDQWVDIYVIRESNHAAIETFAQSSTHPVVNAMSSKGHPCEVLSDAFSLWEVAGSLRGLKFCIVGPPTNVLNSWVEFCELFALDYVQVAPSEMLPSVKELASRHTTSSLEEGLRSANVVLTDAWPGASFDLAYQVTSNKLKVAAENVMVIPCPPFDTTREVDVSVINSPYFAGYEQKVNLYHIHGCTNKLSVSLKKGLLNYP
jgi:ornithine carbamoyltransferase